MLNVYKRNACMRDFVGYVEKLPKEGERMSYKDSTGKIITTAEVEECFSEDCGISYIVFTSEGENFEIL